MVRSSTVAWSICLAMMAGLWVSPPAFAANLSVTVVSSGGEPLAGVRVCAGTADERGLYGVAATGANGVASLYYAPPSSQSMGSSGPLQTATVLVTASQGASFAERTVPGVLNSVILTLPFVPKSQAVIRRAGPFCPQVASGSSGGGTIGVDRRAITQGAQEAARNIGRQPYTTTTINTTSPPQHCFGAVGAECDIAFCVGNTCAVSGGSWEHDECCFRNYRPGSPMGMGCAAGPVDEFTMSQDTMCNAAWSKANLRQASGFFWLRDVNRNDVNATGIVDRAKYCALAGNVVHKDDAKYCCSGRARTANGFTDAAALNGRPWISAVVCEP